MIPYSRQNINKTDINAVKKVLSSNFLTQGPLVNKFEQLIKNYVGSEYAFAVNSATSGLHLACLALGIKKGDIVWTVPNTFAATANCALNCGAKVDFVDIDKDDWNMSVSELEKKLIKAKKKSKLPAAVIPVHFAGQPTEQKKIWLLSKKFKFKIIEDASHSIGAKHYGEKVGSCRWSDITVFSFHPVKIITTGEGGMITTNNKNFAKKIEQLRNNGITQKNFIFKKNKKNPWYYEHQLPGYNYRMNDLSASLGISQFKRIKKFINYRNAIALVYKKKLKKTSLKFQKIMSYNNSSYHLFPIKFDLKKLKYSYYEIFHKLRKAKFYVNLHYMPLHLSPYFKAKGFYEGQFKHSENYAQASISIPIYYGLKLKKIDKIVKLINSFFNE